MKNYLSSILLAICVSLLSSCNQDIILNSYEDTPRVAETILDMPVQQAINYLEKQGFYQGDISSPAGEYVFSKDAGLSHFSQDAAIVLAFGAADSVKIVFAVHRMQSEDSAYDLYWKWSHFAQTVMKTEVSLWRGIISFKEQSGNRTSYCEGTRVKQAIKDLDESLKNGSITQEQYDEMKATYMLDRKQFWADYKNAVGNVRMASEDYTNDESTAHPKEIHLYLDMNNGGDIELKYSTCNFVIHWI